MKLSSTFFALLCAATAIARPDGTGLARRMEERSKYGPITKPNRSGSGGPMVPANFTDGSVPNTNGTASQYYTTNWAGAIITAPPSGETFNIVMAEFVVPVPQPPTTGAGVWYGTAWVGIDGFTYTSAILQTGIDWGVEVFADGSVAYGYWAWYEWYPNGWSDFNLSVSGGDKVELLVEALSTSVGYCAIMNQNTDISVSEQLTAPSTSNYLEGKNAEWIVEDFTSGGLVDFANFGSVTFTQTMAVAGNTNVPANASSASTCDIVGSLGQVVTSVSFPGTNEVTVTYT